MFLEEITERFRELKTIRALLALVLCLQILILAGFVIREIEVVSQLKARDDLLWKNIKTVDSNARIEQAATNQALSQASHLRAVLSSYYPHSFPKGGGNYETALPVYADLDYGGADSDTSSGNARSAQH